MNVPFVLAQANLGSAVAASQRVIRIAKPQDEQAISLRLDNTTRLDFSDIGNEKITYVHVGDRLVILFDNSSTISIAGFFDQNGKPFQDLSIEVDGGRVISGADFATLFPIGENATILPAGGEPRSGANFSDASVDGLGGAGDPLGLMSGEGGAGQYASASRTEAANTRPRIGPIAIGNSDEEGLSEGNIGGPGDMPGEDLSITVSLNVDFGQDVTGRTLTFAATQPGLGGLLSGGQAVTVAMTTIDGLPALVGYTGADPNDATNHVFTVTLDATPLPGQYTFTLLQPLDHPIAGTEDSIRLAVNFTATDGDGDFADGTFLIDINDDSPEDGIVIVGLLTEDLGGPVSVVERSLDISWGADRFNQIMPGSPADRSIAFTQTDPTQAGENVTVAGTSSFAGPLTSSGKAVLYTLIGGVLVGYVDPEQGGPLQDLDDSRIVFTVSLSDVGPDGKGSYSFELRQALDHPAPDGMAHDIDLTFHFSAFDSDGDPVDSTFTVEIDANGVITGAGKDIDYSTLTEGVFINLHDSPLNGPIRAGVPQQHVAGNTATDIDGLATQVVGIDGLGTQLVNATGGAGDDVIFGGQEANVLRGNGGGDLLRGLGGDDMLYGDAGDDEFLYALGDGTDVVDGGVLDEAVGDRLFVNGNADRQSLTLTGISPTAFSVETDGVAGAEITATNVEAVTISMGGGADALTVNALDSDETITLTGNAARFNITSTSLPTVTVTSSESITVNGHGGDDTIDASGLNPGVSATAGTALGNSGNSAGPFGETNLGLGYLAQTFVAKAGLLDQLSVTLEGVGGPDATDFRILIVVWDTVNNRPMTGAPLYESATISVDVGAMQDVTVAPNVTLTPGTTYAFILDAFVGRDGIDGWAGFPVMAGAEAAEPGGLFVNSGDGSSREANFATGWHTGLSFLDLAYQLSYRATPIVTLDGGDGNDTITGSTGADAILGGADNDTIHYAIGTGRDTVDGGTGTDTLNVTGDGNEQSVTLTPTSATNFTIDTDGVGDAEIEATSIEKVNFDLAGGTDTLTVNGSDDSQAITLTAQTATSFSIDADGMAGDEIVAANVENVTFNMGDGGVDTLTVNALDSSDTITLTGNAASFTVAGTNLPTTTVTSAESVTVNGNGGDDTIDASGLTPGVSATAGTALGNSGNSAGPFGETNLGLGYLAQTFVAKAGLLDQLSVTLQGVGGPDATDFRILIVVWDTVNNRPMTGAPLYESATISVDVGGMQDVTVAPNVTLAPGTTYAFILDAFVGRDGIDGWAGFPVMAGAEAAEPGGLFVNPGDGPSREENFATGWHTGLSFFDLAYRLSYRATPMVTLDGGDGNDTIIGSAGNDAISGGTGNDAINYTIGAGHDTVDGGTNLDTLNITGDGNAQSMTLTAISATSFTVDADGVGHAEIEGTSIEQVNLDLAGGTDALTVNGRDTTETITLSGSAASFTVTGTHLPTTVVTGGESIAVNGNDGDDTIDASALNITPPGAPTTDGTGLSAPSALTPFGDTTAQYYAQTFVANGEVLSELSFSLRHLTGVVDFRVLLVEWDTINNRPVSNVPLYESATQVYDTAGTEIFAVAPNQVLAQGHIYAFILDVHVAGAAQTGSADISAFPDGSPENAELGGIYYIPWGNTSRDDAFSQSWQSDVAAYDLAYRLVYSWQQALDVRLDGGDGNDTITGSSGNDAIFGGTGDDTINYAISTGRDTVDGGADLDTLNITGNGNAQSMTLTVTSATSFTVDADGVAGVEIAATNVEQVNVELGTGIDALTVAGLDAAEVIALWWAQNSIMIGGDNLPTIIEKDVEQITIQGNGGDDTINATGLDTAHSATLTLDGGDGNDVIAGSNRNDTILGGFGNDYIVGRKGSDTLNGGEGDDVFDYSIGDGVDTIEGGEGAEAIGDVLVVRGAANAHTMTLRATSATTFTLDTDGSAAAEILASNVEILSIEMGGGSDALTVLGLDTDETTAIYGIGSNFTVFGGSLPAMAVVDAEVLTVQGNGGNDTIDAGGLNPIGFSLGGVSIDGGDGNDVITGSVGHDMLYGGTGDDRFNYAVGDGFDTIDGGEDSETVGDRLFVTGDAGADAMTLYATTNGFLVDANGQFGPEIAVTNVELAIFAMGSGSDALTVSGSVDGETIALSGTQSSFTVSGTNLPNTTVTGDEAITINGNGGDDTIDASGLTGPFGSVTAGTALSSNDGLGNFGDAGPGSKEYFAQTFIAQGESLATFAFAMFRADHGSVDFRAMIVAWDTEHNRPVDAAPLYESQALGFNGNDEQVFAFEPHVALTEGQTYAIVLDSHVEGNSVSGYANVSAFVWGVHTQEPGGLYTYSGGDRDAAFSNGWATDLNTFDLAYQVTYDDAPLSVTLDGGFGNDTITGTGGVDVIIGGIGNDILTGNSGGDDFIFSEAGDLHADTITDYNATQGDKLDLSALLDASFDPNSDLVAEFVRLVNDDTNVKVQVDVDGAGGADWATVATLTDYRVAGNEVLVEFENQVHQLTVAA